MEDTRTIKFGFCGQAVPLTQIVTPVTCPPKAETKEEAK
jgi:hypothetical protein